MPRTTSPGKGTDERHGQSLKRLLHQASVTPRFAMDHRNDTMMQLLRDKAFVDEIHQYAKHRKSVLVTLPKIGVRMFSLKGAPPLASCFQEEPRLEQIRQLAMETSGGEFGHV